VLGGLGTALTLAKTAPTPHTHMQEQLGGVLAELGVTGEVTNRWAGTIGFTEAGLPLAGLVERMPKVYLCTRFSGYEMGCAFTTAKRVPESL
jgi:glycine/D-amino acid oxidase-like deaminating enzyme